MSELTELKVSATLLDGKKEVTTLEKLFGLVNGEEKKEPESKETTKSIDTIVGEFLDEMDKAAIERGYIPNKIGLAEASVRVILFLVKHSEPELKLTIPLEKPKPKEEKQSGDQTNP